MMEHVSNEYTKSNSLQNEALDQLLKTVEKKWFKTLYHMRASHTFALALPLCYTFPRVTQCVFRLALSSLERIDDMVTMTQEKDDLVNALLVRVGADQSRGGGFWNGLVDT